jgi:predicted RNase H-like nuclease (RuvC/YqgF family)
MKWMRSVSSRLLLFVIAETTIAVSAQTLDQYKAAAEAAAANEGCLSIPGGDVRDRCIRAADLREQDCNQKRHGCQGLENKALTEKIEDKENYISSLKKETDEQDRKKSSARHSERSAIEKKIKQLEDKIEKHSRDLEKLKKKVANARTQAGIRADQGRRCLEKLNEIQYLFNAARSAAESEREAEKKPYADKLMDYWDQGSINRIQESKKVKEAIEYCEKCKKGDL